MKKLLITLAVTAGSVAAAQAADTTTLYGSIGYTSEIAESSIDTSGNLWNNTTEGVKKTAESIKENHWQINQERARLGVRGTEDLGNGLQAEFKFEVQNSGSSNGLDGTRDVYVGLKGDSWGTVRLGRQGSTWNVDEDYFRSSGPAAGLAWTPGRSDKTIKYISPDFSGLNFAGRIYADKADQASLGVDQWDASINYDANNIKASASYAVKYHGHIDQVHLARTGKKKVIDDGSTESMGVQVGYENDEFGAYANAQHQSSSDTVYNVQGKYKFGPNEVRAGFGYKDTRNSDVDVYALAAGYQYNFSKRTSTWVEGRYADETKGNKDADFSATVGIRHDF